MKSYKRLKIDWPKNGHLEIQLNRPERLNGIGSEIAAELNEVFFEIAESLKRTGNTEPHFNKTRILSLTLIAPACQTKNSLVSISGGDLKELGDFDNNSEEIKTYISNMTYVCRAIEELPVLCIGVAEGRVIGGGVELFLPFDTIIGSNDTCFEFKQLKVGLPLGYGSTVRLSQRVGGAKARSWVYAQRVLSSVELVQEGLLSFLTQEHKNADSILNDIRESVDHGSGAYQAQKKQFLSAGCQSENDFFHPLWGLGAHKDHLKKFNGDSRKN